MSEILSTEELFGNKESPKIVSSEELFGKSPEKTNSQDIVSSEELFSDTKPNLISSVGRDMRQDSIGNPTESFKAPESARNRFLREHPGGARPNPEIDEPQYVFDESFKQGLYGHVPLPATRLLQEKYPVISGIAQNMGSVGGLLTVGELLNPVVKSGVSAAIDKYGLSLLPEISSAARVGASTATFGIKSALDKLSGSIQGKPITGNDIKEVLSDATTGAPFGAADSIAKPMLRMPAQAMVMAGISKLQGADNLSAAISGLAGGLFGLLHTSDLGIDYKKQAVAKVHEDLSLKLNELGVPLKDAVNDADRFIYGSATKATGITDPNEALNKVLENPANSLDYFEAMDKHIKEFSLELQDKIANGNPKPKTSPEKPIEPIGPEDSSNGSGAENAPAISPIEEASQHGKVIGIDAKTKLPIIDTNQSASTTDLPAAPEPSEKAATPIEQQGGSNDQTQEGQEKGNVLDENPTVLTSEQLGISKEESPSQVSEASPKYQSASPAFYSQVEKVINEKMPNAATPEMVRGILSEKNGVKKEEIEWLGLDDFLSGKSKVTKQELQDFMKQNQVEIKEVEKSETIKDEDKLTEARNKRMDFEDNFREKLDSTDMQSRQAWSEYDAWGKDYLEKKYPQEIEEYENLLKNEQKYSERALSSMYAGNPKFSQYQLPGGKNYRELLLTLPAHDQFMKGNDTFKSGHFEEPNILAHVRMNDRIDADGKKVLFIEEVQSDWHQKGRKQGYSSKDNHIDKDFREGVPDAPFKKTWHELAMKRILRYAAENGYDKVAWTTGEQQAERYDLSKHITSIEAIRRKDNSGGGKPGEYILRMIDKNGQRVNANAETANVPSEKLADFVGKDLAEKIINQKEDSHTYAGVDLKVGGEGMKGFYDQILPSFMNKYVKKWGSKVETGQLDIPKNMAPKGEKEVYFPNDKSDIAFVHSVEITPLMRSVVMEGQSLFENSPVYGKLKKESESAYDSNDARKKAIERAIQKTELSLRPRGDSRPSTKVSKIAKDFRESGYVDVVGKEVSTSQDAAEIASLFRSPYVEHFQVMILKDGKIVAHQVYTSGNPLTVKISNLRKFIDDIERSANDLGSTEVYISHNHPSGNPTPSVDDIDLTHYLGFQLQNKGITVKGHVITNGEHYALIDGSTMASPELFKYEHYKELKPKFDRSESDKKAVTTYDFVNEARKFIKEGQTSVIFVDANNKVISMDNVANDQVVVRTNDLLDSYKAAGAVVVRAPGLSRDFNGLSDRVLDVIEMSDFYHQSIPFTPTKENLSTVRIRENTPKYKKSYDLSSESGQANLPGINEVAAMTRELINFLAPRIFVPRESLDVVMTELGKRNALEFKLETQLKSMVDMFEKMPRAEQVAFIDNIKLGKSQATPQLQSLANMMRIVEDRMYTEARQYKPSLPYLENHYRVLWKVIPGSPQAKGTAFKGLFRRPLQGSKGFTKQHTLETMSDGLANGGVPYSYNPMIMWQNGLMDMQKFITANRMFKTLKDNKSVVFVKLGGKAPDGFVKLDDRMANVYFPTDPGLVHAGNYYIEENVGRILNNFLSRDLIRESEIGKNLMAFKNITTSIELSLSPFHAAYTSLTAIATDIGAGLQKMYNIGLLKGNGEAFIKGLGDVVFSIKAPYQLTRIGTNAIQMVRSDQFLQTPSGKAFLKEFPNAKDLLVDLFTGGGKLAIHQDYKINAIHAFKDGLKNREPWAVTISALPAAHQVIMGPLFEMYIPRLKIGSFLKEYSVELVARHEQLVSGKLTRPQLAHQVWDSIENRFGEMNFDNLFWDRTFKSAMQLVFRSVTWKIGALKNISSGTAGQVKEIYDAIKGRHAPLLNRNTAYLLGLGMLIVAAAEIIMKSNGQGDPKDLKDIMAPRYDSDGNRISLNTHLKDWVHILHNPVGFVSNSLSGDIGKEIDIWNNKDFYGVKIYNEDDPLLKREFDKMKHRFPTPFTISSQKSLKGDNAPLALKVSTAAGFTQPSPGYMINTPAENMAIEMVAERMPQGSRTQAQFDKSKERKDLREKYAKTQDEAILRNALEEGKIDRRQYKEIKKEAGMSKLERMTIHLGYDDVAKIMEVAASEEKKILFPIVIKKIRNKLERAYGSERKDIVEYRNEFLKRFSAN